MTEVPGQLVCPSCYQDERLEPALPRQLPLARPDSTYYCPRGHQFDYPRRHLPRTVVDVEETRRERLRDALP